MTSKPTNAANRPPLIWRRLDYILMAKEELLVLDGQIDEVLPDGRFRVHLENDHSIIAYTAGRMRRFRIRSIVGDRVQVEMTPYDLSKGRIIYRERTSGPGGAPRKGGRGGRR